MYASHTRSVSSLCCLKDVATCGVLQTPSVTLATLLRPAFRVDSHETSSYISSSRIQTTHILLNDCSTNKTPCD